MMAVLDGFGTKQLKRAETHCDLVLRHEWEEYVMVGRLGFPRFVWVTGLLSPMIALSSLSAAVLQQSASRGRFGDKPFAYFFIEAEDFDSNDPRGDGESWLLSSEEDALLVSVQPDLEPDPGKYASGGESITNSLFTTTVTNESGGGHDIQYRLEFDTAGDYYLYIRQHSPLGPENNRNPNDSFYAPIEFGEDPDSV